MLIASLTGSLAGERPLANRYRLGTHTLTSE
jgi:hypothetical protein